MRIDSRLTFRLVLGTGALLAIVLCAQCIRTYLYTDAVLVPQQAQREAERQSMALSNAARSAGISDARALGPVIEHALESAADRILWIRVMDMESNVFVEQGGARATGTALPDWKERMTKHLPPGVLLNTAEGKAYVAMLPLRMPRQGHPPETAVPGPGRRREAGLGIEMAISLKAVRRTFDGLRENLVVGMIASFALLVCVVVIGLRAPQYLRGKYLESEMELARRVQRDLQPAAHASARDFEFAASAVAADHVGGDFYDVFEAAPGKTAIVLGDVSGKGIAAALLVGVLQGAIRSSAASEHETACERINRMLWERTARTRFATLFWGIYDAETGTLQYVNAGHAAPMLIREGGKLVDRLDQGGPVLGLLPQSRYGSGLVRIGAGDTLVIYSDGVNEAADQNEEEFGEDRLAETIARAGQAKPEELCEQIMSQVAAFAMAGPPPDDRTLLVARFPGSRGAAPQRAAAYAQVPAIA